jgi:outer membrane murein-binding lipoprotein Lpp
MKTLIIAVCVLALAGCASLKYETKEGTKVTYNRLFTTADTLKAKVGDANVEIGGQKINADTINALLGLLGAAAK